MQKDSHIQKDSSKRHIIDKSLFINNFIEVIDNAHKRHVAGCAQKAEKIWTACILVSRVMAQGSAVSLPLVETSGRVHKTLYEVTRSSITESSLLPVLSLLDEVLSLIRVASVSEDISPMNAAVLGKEIGLLSDQVRRLLVAIRTFRTHGFGGGAQSFFEEGVVLQESLFRSEAFDTSRFGDLPSANSFASKEVASYTGAENKDPSKTTQNDNQNDIIKDTRYVQNDTKRQSNLSDTTKNTLSKSVLQKDVPKTRFSRQDEVLKIIRIRKDATIQDVASYVPDCSIKTLQRILNDLITSGLVEKRGNKRWTTYHIVKG